MTNNAVTAATAVASVTAPAIERGGPRNPRRTPRFAGLKSALASMVGQLSVLGLICLLTIASGQTVVALAAAIVIAAGWAAAVLSMDRLVPIVLAITLVLENPAEQPFAGLWSTPLSQVAKIWYATLAAQTGIPVPLSPLIGAVLILGFRAFVGATGSDGRPLRHRDGRLVAPPVTFRKAAAVSTGIVGFMWFLSIATGGSFPQSQFQVIGPLLFPIIAIAAAASTTNQLVRRIERVILATAAYRSLLCIYAWWTVARTANPAPEYVTIHSDAVLWTTAIMIVVSRVVVDPKRAWRSAAWMVPLFLAATVFNERRLSYVAIAAGLAWIFFRSPRETQRSVMELARYFGPVGLVYLGAGWNSNATPFKMAQAIKSVFVQDDASSDSRKVENLNLIFTYIRSPLRGIGYGKPYLQLVPSVDLTANFKLFLYVPHNSILALWGFIGVVGFTGLWLVKVIGLTHLVEAHRGATTQLGRTLGLWTGCALISYVVQGWGDIGLQAWMPIFIGAIALGVGAAAAGLEPIEADDALTIERQPLPDRPMVALQQSTPTAPGQPWTSADPRPFAEMPV